MQDAPAPTLFNRHDTFFGVCEGLGQDLNVNPFFLRIGFGVALLWNPVLVLATYVVLGITVAVTRWLYPTPNVAAVETPVAATAEANDDTQVPTALAA